MQQSRLRTICTPLFIFSLTACHPKIQPGHYEGNLLRRVAGKYQILPIRLKMNRVGPKKLSLEVSNQAHEILITGTLEKPRKSQIVINLSGIYSTNSTLSESKIDPGLDQSVCFLEPKDQLLSLCFNSFQFFLRQTDQNGQSIITLSGSLFRDTPRVKLETPREYILSESIQEALTENYETRISLEHVLQARQSAIAAWLNLFPHLSVNLIWNAPIPTYVSTLATLQALTPFLLPNWWLDGKIATINSRVERDALQILRADLISSIEQLFYSVERDSKILEAYQRVSRLPISDAELEETIRSGINVISKILKEDLFALSLALGKNNPEAVEKATIGQELISVDQAVPIKPSELAEWALERSFELEQINYLYEIAKIREIELYFSWIDPSADQKTSLGLNLFAQTKIARSQIRELEIKRDQIKAQVYKKSYLLAIEYNSALESLKAGKSEQDIQVEYAQIEAQLSQSSQNTPPLVEASQKAIKSYLADLTARETLLAAYRIARAKKDRLILEGYFEDLLPQLPSINFRKRTKPGIQNLI